METKMAIDKMAIFFANDSAGLLNRGTNYALRSTPRPALEPVDTSAAVFSRSTVA